MNQTSFRAVNMPNALPPALSPEADTGTADPRQGRLSSQNALSLRMPEDDFARVEEEKLSQRRYPDWFVLTTLSNSFPNLAVNGLVPLGVIASMRDQLHAQGRFREARVANQLLANKKILLNSGTPWNKGRFQSLPAGYSWADIQWMLGKINAGQDIDDIITRYYDRKSREAIYRANWAEIINVPLTLFVALTASGFAFSARMSKLLKSVKPKV